ncbi:MAG: dual specificity protein phosphatase family protein [Acidobacteria bacterium]|nr:dual specificity protein phosphatase family protein [Acidobacteriota bacterium]
MNDVFWIDGTGLAIVLRPRGDDWLENDLQRIRMAGIQTIVSTIEPHEARDLGLTDEGPTVERLGMHFISFPLRDRSVPSNRAGFTEFVLKLAKRVQAGEKIGVHCRGCIGRSSVVVASTLIKLGWTAERALDEIEVARGCSIPDTEEQRDWILDFGATD